MSYRSRAFKDLTVGEIKNLDEDDIKRLGAEVGKAFLEKHPEMVAGLGEKLIRENIATLKALDADLMGE